MRENELIHEIRQIADTAESLSGALNRIRCLLASEWGGALLLIRGTSAHSPAAFPPAVSEFLESRAFPFRGLYVASLEAGGKFVACVGAWGEPAESLRRVVDFTGAELSRVARRVSVGPIEYAKAA